MATFLDTTGISFRLEQLIKGTNSQLILISPYLQLNDRIKEHLGYLATLKKDVRLVYRENKLQPDETNWIAERIGIRTSLCKNLHAKCYLNDSEAIVTSMNLYEFSQVHNNEMGIHITKEQDPLLYADVLKEVSRLLTISDEIRVTVQQVFPAQTEKVIPPKPSSPGAPSAGYFSATALSKQLDISSKELLARLEGLKLITRVNDAWELTELGKQKGGQIRKGQYGEYIAWPEKLVTDLK